MNPTLEKLKNHIRKDINQELKSMDYSEGLAKESHRWNLARLEARLQGIGEAERILL